MADLASPPVEVAAPAFEVFLAASALDAAGAPGFQEQADRFTPGEAALHPLAEAAAPQPLRPRRHRTDKVLAARRSERSFAPEALDLRSVEDLFGALRPMGEAPVGEEATRRAWPSAGALASVQVHLIARNVSGGLDAGAHRYVFDGHALARVADRPTDAALRQACSIDGDLPPIVVVLGVLVEPMLAKYGERGGRFALIEVGAAAQTLSLRAAELGLRGYLLGGILDHEVTDLVGATGTGYRALLGYAVGR